ncbi:hypothetical protein JYU34_015389, partial [Plutella xylostella]
MTAKNGAAGKATRHGSAASHAPPANASFPSTPDTQPVLQPCEKQDRLSVEGEREGGFEVKITRVGGVDVRASE